MPLADYLKRVWVWHTNRKAINKSLKERKGKCKQCGKCCVILGFKCPFLSKDNKCKIYKYRPLLLCKIPPLNLFKGEREKHKKIDCGFYWEEKKK